MTTQPPEITLSRAQRIAALFNVLPGEGRVLVPLLAQALLLGLTQVWVRATANTLFLLQFGAENMPFIYFSAGILAPLVGILYAKLRFSRSPHGEPGLRADKAVYFTVGALGSSLVVLLILRLALQAASTGSWPALFLFIWFYVQEILISLGYWSLVEQMLDVRQGKRLNGLLGAGNAWGRILGGAGLVLLAQWISMPNILIAAAISLVSAIALLAYLLIARPPAAGHSPRRSSQPSSTASPASTSFRALLKDPYIRLMAALTVFALVGFYFVDQIYQFQIAAAFTEPKTLLIFVGAFEALMSLTTLLATHTITQPLVRRFGLLAGMLALPVVATLAIIPLALTGLIFPGAALFIWMVLTTKLLVVSFRRSVDRSAARTLYQPLDASARDPARLFIERIVEPGSAAVAGLLLLILPASATLPIFVLVAILVLWVVVAVLVNQSYRSTLTQAITQRSLNPAAFNPVDASSMAVLARGLQSPNPGSVLYILDVLEEASHPALEDSLKKLIQHPAPEVRCSALMRIERLNLTGAQEQVQAIIDTETVPAVKGQALRCLAVLSEEDLIDYLTSFFDHPEPAVRLGAMVGMMRGSGLDGILEAGDSVIEMAYASDPARRMMAAQVLGEVGVSNFYRPVLRLLRDRDTRVRKAALEAAGKLKNPHLWPFTIQALETPALRAAARRAIIEGGPAALPHIRLALSTEHLSSAVRVSLAMAAGKIGAGRRNHRETAEEATALLLEHIDHPDALFRNAVILALRICRYQAGPKDASRIERTVEQEAEGAAWSLAARADLPAGNPDLNLLRQALLEKFARHRQQAVMLLSFLYQEESANTLIRAWQTLQTSNLNPAEKAQALEDFEATLTEQQRQAVMPLLEDLPTEERLRRLNSRYPQASASLARRLEEIAFSNNPAVTPWLRASAFYAQSRIDPAHYQHHATELETLPNAWAAPVRAILQSGATGLPISQGGTPMLSTIEKVLILRNVYVFSETQDEILVEIASAMEEITVAAGQTLLRKGETGKALYIVIDGQLRVHYDRHTFAYRESGEVLGEMSIMDGLPVSASVTATKETRLLHLDQELFYDLMADRAEIARGIIRMLAQRLRAVMEDQAGVESTVPPPAPDTYQIAAF